MYLKQAATIFIACVQLVLELQRWFQRIYHLQRLQIIRYGKLNLWRLTWMLWSCSDWYYYIAKTKEPSFLLLILFLKCTCVTINITNHNLYSNPKNISVYYAPKKYILNNKHHKTIYTSEKHQVLSMKILF
jgi:hypothetical protein